MFARARLLPLGAFAVASWLGCEATTVNDHPMVGEEAPSFTAAMLDGSPFDLSDYLGKDVVILDFWATWCGPCIRSLPTLSDVAAEYRDRGVRLFAVDIGETPQEVHQFLENSPLDLTVVMDPDGAISDLYRVEPIPHTVIIGSDGTVRVVHIGASPNLRAEFTRELDQILAGK